ncbi:hypothetical protein PVAND_006256 [Polypedilum vanderplanki]|uniref:Uncharacterized protein n=1 Tax=Polypedilum vanderplanki TaxID=319348 RepID=A0A9J6C330_POLVA|nr:hypothetical protein PVAND_006256 [Polypedilum vanderplanki]
MLLLSSVVKCQNNDPFERSPIIPPSRRPLPPELVNNNLDEGWGRSLMQSAKNFVASPIGQLTVSMAKEFVARSAGGNQVLSLNMGSLLILVLLKALIFATGLLGVGNYSHYGRGRMLEGNSIIDGAEMQLYLGFLAAEGSNKDACLYRAVCLEPEHATEYLKAGRALLEGFGIFDPAIPNNQRYNEYLQNVNRAILEGMNKAPCNMIYSCDM